MQCKWTGGVMQREDKRLYIEIQRWRCKQECEVETELKANSVRRKRKKQRECERESLEWWIELEHGGETGILVRETGSERGLRGGWEWKRWLRQSRGEQKREFISSQGKAEVSCSAFTSQAHLNVKMRRGDAITIKARQRERRVKKNIPKKRMHSCSVTNTGF